MAEVQRAQLTKSLAIGKNVCEPCAERGITRKANGIFGDFPRYNGENVKLKDVKGVLYVCDDCAQEIMNREPARANEARKRQEAKALLEAMLEEDQRALRLRRAREATLEAERVARSAQADPGDDGDILARLDFLLAPPVPATMHLAQAS